MHAEYTTLEACAARGRPFIAFVQSPFGRHAVVVDLVEDARLTVVDPLYAQDAYAPKAAFLETWSGIAVWIE